MSFFVFPDLGHGDLQYLCLNEIFMLFFHNTLKIKQEKLDCFGRKILKNGRLF